MKVVQCPEIYDGSGPKDVVIFIAGGISGCPDWQKEMVERFKGVENLVLLNPRRADFNMDNPGMTVEQIKWEYDHLNTSDAVIFWFPFHTLCPITLFELGVASALDQVIFVGCHPAYKRLLDVREQLALSRPDVTVHSDFNSIVTDVNQWISSNK